MGVDGGGLVKQEGHIEEEEARSKETRPGSEDRAGLWLALIR